MDAVCLLLDVGFKFLYSLPSCSYCLPGFSLWNMNFKLVYKSPISVGVISWYNILKLQADKGDASKCWVQCATGFIFNVVQMRTKRYGSLAHKMPCTFVESDLHVCINETSLLLLFPLWNAGSMFFGRHCQGFQERFLLASSDFIIFYR